MNIIAISGSPRKMNTYRMIETVLDAAESKSEIIILKENEILPCNDCRSCHKNHGWAIQDDMAGLLSGMKEADVIILGSPTYFHNVSGPMKNFMDRCLPFYFSRKFEGKKAILLTSANFEDQLEFGSEGGCKWHNEEKESVKRCLKSMEYFCDVLGIEVIGRCYALHDDWKSEEKELKRLGRHLSNQ